MSAGCPDLAGAGRPERSWPHGRASELPPPRPRPQAAGGGADCFCSSMPPLQKQPRSRGWPAATTQDTSAHAPLPAAPGTSGVQCETPCVQRGSLGLQQRAPWAQRTFPAPARTLGGRRRRRRVAFLLRGGAGPARGCGSRPSARATHGWLKEWRVRVESCGSRKVCCCRNDPGGLNSAAGGRPAASRRVRAGEDGGARSRSGSGGSSHHPGRSINWGVALQVPARAACHGNDYSR